MKNNRIGLFVVFLLTIVLFAANLLYGSVEIPLIDVLAALTGKGSENEVWRLIVLEMRLPQAVTALLAGAVVKNSAKGSISLKK